MGTTIEITFGATNRGTTRHLLSAEHVALCGQIDAADLDREGSMIAQGDHAWTVKDRLHHEGGRIVKLPVCSRCALYAAALHAAASDG